MALSLDGEVTVNSGAATSVTTPTLTTTAGSGVIVVLYVANAAPAVSNPVTATGLTFTQRFSTSTGSDFYAEYTAPYTTNFSGTITVTASSSTFITVLAFGVGGAATSSFFDTNASLPAVITGGGGATVSYSTSNANDFIFGFCVNSLNPGAPWTVIDAIAQSNFLENGYRIVSSTQSSQTFPANGEGAVDAIIAASGGDVLQAQIWL